MKVILKNVSFNADFEKYSKIWNYICDIVVIQFVHIYYIIIIAIKL